MSKLQDIQSAVETGKLKQIESIVQDALSSGETATDVLNCMIDTMGIIGEKFQRNEIFVPEMLVAALTMKKGVSILQPHLKGDETTSYGKFIVGTVEGDLHDIGKNLVALMVESAGFEVIDLGVDVSADKFVQALKDNPDCKILGLSALLTTTMDAMKNTVRAVADAGLRDQVKIMVGGAPITPEFAAEIGADVYTADAGSASAKAKELAS